MPQPAQPARVPGRLNRLYQRQRERAAARGARGGRAAFRAAVVGACGDAPAGSRTWSSGATGGTTGTPCSTGSRRSGRGSGGSTFPDRHIASKRRQGLAPKTIANHLRTLSAMFQYARRRRRMTANPVGLLEPLHVPTPETPVLSEQEVAALLNAPSRGDGRRRGRSRLVGAGAPSDGVRARHRSPPRRDPRAPLAGRGDARPAAARAARVRPR
jgi:hypothetical protein